MSKISLAIKSLQLDNLSEIHAKVALQRVNRDSVDWALNKNDIGKTLLSLSESDNSEIAESVKLSLSNESSMSTILSNKIYVDALLKSRNASVVLATSGRALDFIKSGTNTTLLKYIKDNSIYSENDNFRMILEPLFNDVAILPSIITNSSTNSILVSSSYMIKELSKYNNSVDLILANPNSMIPRIFNNRLVIKVFSLCDNHNYIINSIVNSSTYTKLTLDTMATTYNYSNGTYLTGLFMPTYNPDVRTYDYYTGGSQYPSSSSLFAWMTSTKSVANKLGLLRNYKPGNSARVLVGEFDRQGSDRTYFDNFNTRYTI